MAGHSQTMETAAVGDLLSGLPAQKKPAVAANLRFEDVYDVWFDFVWRSVRRLGVDDSSTDDVVQDVFMIVHRRLQDFEGRSEIRTWLFGIVLRVVRQHRRTLGRDRRRHAAVASIERLHAPAPIDALARAQASQLLLKMLDELDDDKREVFVLADLEQVPMARVAETLSENVNTCYARLRAARAELDRALAKHRAQEARRVR